MAAIYFIEKNGDKLYKTDTFWSLSKYYKYAKIYSDDKESQKKYLNILMPIINTIDNNIIEYYDKILFGYQSIEKFGDIVKTVYLYYIEYDENINEFKAVDYKQKNRENKINELLD